jgi:hypothetical protein
MSAHAQGQAGHLDAILGRRVPVCPASGTQILGASSATPAPPPRRRRESSSPAVPRVLAARAGRMVGMAARHDVARVERAIGGLPHRNQMVDIARQGAAVDAVRMGREDQRPERSPLGRGIDAERVRASDGPAKVVSIEAAAPQ